MENRFRTLARHRRELIYETSRDDLCECKLNNPYRQRSSSLTAAPPASGPGVSCRPGGLPRPTGVPHPCTPTRPAPPDSTAAASAASGPGAQSATARVSRVLQKHARVGTGRPRKAVLTVPTQGLSAPYKPLRTPRRFPRRGHPSGHNSPQEVKSEDSQKCSTHLKMITMNVTEC